MKVHLRTLGCRLNQSEIETMGRQFVIAGHEVVESPEQADRIIVNTCAVTQDAAHTSRKLVRQMHHASPQAAITVTGCYSQIAPDAITVLPGVESVVSNQDKDGLVAHLTDKPVEFFDREPVERDALHWIGRTRAFVKAQDGCDNACTFCVTTVARGEGRSRTINHVLCEIRSLLAMGYKEIVLTGVHLGSYGHDFGDKQGLFHLVKAILDQTDAPRVRLSSLEPWDLDRDFFTLWQDCRLCPHLHLPLQSGCDSTLRRMARRTNQRQFRELVRLAREASENPCITTDIIAGFPGESDAEFEESIAFVKSLDFAGMHVFRYSRRPGTAAARMRGHVDEAVKKARSARYLALAQAREAAYARDFAGQTLEVLWEHISGATEAGFINVGYTGNYIRVACIHPRPLTNELLPVRLDNWNTDKQYMLGTPAFDDQLN
ncbi:MAG: tRNA (N(6)-L-threonylcarbamoyladenosine(37)-C(2))-methylthiotransferase MtaB [Anaerolineae bacterium]|nr:tRNA (N(6)-L-threonylcarbamoyladenosine(37)-C(2))-methylthiotransferase MtaB [Anaerolineae bacterium]